MGDYEKAKRCWLSPKKDNKHVSIKKLLSEVPCHLIGDPHEWFNQSHTVLNCDSAKLKWL